jgi:hypothetical protein
MAKSTPKQGQAGKSGVKSREQRVKEAVEDIRAFYKLGRKNPPQERRGRYGQESTRKQAEKRGTTPQMLYKARQLADPKKGYTPREINDLISLMETVQPKQDDTKAIFSRTHLIRLLPVKPKELRNQLQKEAIEEGWSVPDLMAEIVKCKGRREHGGRKHRMPADLAGLLVKVDSMAETWRRWYDSVYPESEGGKREWALEARPPADIQKLIDDAYTALGKLQDAAKKKLHKIGRKLEKAGRPSGKKDKQARAP